ncbi:hypothetical protein JOE11_003246 [Robbsia andropogonis]
MKYAADKMPPVDAYEGVKQDCVKAAHETQKNLEVQNPGTGSSSSVAVTG